jgi:hypothetical protein
VADDIVTRLRSAGKCLDGHICSKCDREVRDDMGCKCVCHDYPWGDAANVIDRFRGDLLMKNRRIGELADHIEELQEEINDLRLQVVILSIPKETGDD